MSNYFRWNAGRKRQGTPTLESQPGAHTGATRKYIPGYSDANRIFLDTAAGNDAWTGANPTNSPAGTGPFLTYAAAATAAGTTKKIRLVNSATLSDNITKPTEATIGTTSSIASSSLTAPFSTWSSVLGSVGSEKIVWSPRHSRFVSVGGSGHIRISTDGQTWTSASSPGYGSTNISDVIYLESTQTFYSVGYAGKVGTSTDGDSWSVSSPSPFGGADLFGISYSETLGRWVCVGSSNGSDTTVNIWYSDDFVNWSKSGTPFIYSQMRSVEYAFGKFIAVSASATGIAYSSDGVSWTAATTGANADTVWVKVYYSALTDKLIAFGTSATDNGRTIISSDGITWALVGTSGLTSTNYMKGVVDCIEIGCVVAVGTANKVYYSADANVWTLATSSGNTNGIAYSPLYETFVIGGNGSIHASTAFATTISAPVAGFSIQAVQYSGTVTAYNCTLKQPGTTAALSLDSCRVTESGSHISNNAVTATATLVEGDIHYTGVYAAANALDLNLNTIDGTLYIYNGSTTHYERIRDNIIENGVVSSYPVTVTSGNTRGTSSDGTIFGQFCTTSDPLFVDTTDYKLQRVLDGYQYDSPMVAASQYYYNQATTQTFRDNGAWSYNESAATYKYQRPFDFLMPATVIGSTIDFIRHNRANLHVAEDGTPDAVNTPGSRWEEIVMQFKTLPADHIDFINWLEGQVDMTCNISLSPSLTPTTAVVASGSTAAGEAVITITDNSGLDSGDQLTIDGNTYTVLYTYGTTKVVLDRVTTTALTDTESITVKYDTGFGEYQYVPMLERRLSRWYETDENYLRGLQIRFARKLP